MAGANESGVVIEVPNVDALVGDWRAQHDPAAGSGVPAHITILYPFMPPGQLTHESLDGLQVIAAGTAPFRFGLVAWTSSLGCSGCARIRRPSSLR